MKRLIVAKSAGFCFGVKRAVDTVYEQAKKEKEPIYTYGPIIHNEAVVEDLEARGVTVIHSIEELRRVQKGTVIIRSHGVEKAVYDKIRELGHAIVDATCPFVLKIHKIVEKYSREGYHIVIIGNSSHPEVLGICGWCDPGKTTVIETVQEAADFEVSGEPEICIVAQTTFNNNKFKELVEIIQKKGYNINVLNTICNATEERQTEARRIAGEVDAMIVIGGRHSSNTQKLFEICKNECENTYYVQTYKDLDLSEFNSVDNVGITAGASTPNNIIEEVQTNVRNEF